jgi:hypothetical protein
MENDDLIVDEIRNLKVSYAAKYQDLDALVQQFFADSNIYDMELNTLGKLDALLTREFRIAQDYIGKMDKNSPMYAAAQELLTHMYRCRNLIDAAHDKAKVYHAIGDDKQKTSVVLPEPVKEEKEVLTIRNVSRGGMLLMASLNTEKQRMAAEQSFSEKEVAMMTPAEREEICLKVVRAIADIHENKADSRRLNHILGLGHTRGSGR